MTISTYQWAIDRYHQAVEAGVFEDQAVELLKGELVLMPPEGTPHAYYSDRAARYLRRLLETDELAYVREAKPITLPNASEPDIAIVQPLDQVYLDHHPYPENVFWVIEYAQSSLTKDLEIKSKVYVCRGQYRRVLGDQSARQATDCVLRPREWGISFKSNVNG